MRSWVEKLVKLIEIEGKTIGGFTCKVLNYEIFFIPENDTAFLTITNEITKECTHIKLYEEEKDIINKAFGQCKEKSINSIIEQITNL